MSVLAQNHRYDKEVKTLKEEISKAKESGVEDMSKLKQALSELEKKGDTLVKKQNELEKKEKVTLFYMKIFDDN